MNYKKENVSYGIKFCGFHTYVTSSGKVIRKLKSDNKRAAKKKLKKMAGLVKQGKLEYSCAVEPLFRRNGNRVSGTWEPPL
jgi:hypothetical protein